MKRFWDKVAVTGADECWLWIGGASPEGYGRIWMHGRAQGAHRVAWELEHGVPAPPNLCVCHRCDKPRCVNPQHLFLGSRADNNADRDAKGRCGATGAPSGEANATAKLSEDRVKALRRERAAGASFRTLGNRFGISASQACRVVNGKYWGAVR